LEQLLKWIVKSGVGRRYKTHFNTRACRHREEDRPLASVSLKYANLGDMPSAADHSFSKLDHVGSSAAHLARTETGSTPTELSST